MILIAQSHWDTVLENFQTDRSQLERVAYLDGVFCGTDAVVTTVTIPHAERQRRYFRVSADAMSAAGQHLLRYGLRRIAQIHTHGDDFIEHSGRDDSAAYSQAIGSTSIVVPFHARRLKDIMQCGVYVRTAHGWSRLTDAEITKHLMIVPALVNLSK